MEIGDIQKDCPGIWHWVEGQLYKTAEKYDKNEKFKELYDMIKWDFGLNSKDIINFENAHFYIDDYMTAKKLKKPLKKDFWDPIKAQDLIAEYNKDYMYDGVLGGNQVPRVISSWFNEWLMK